MGFTCTSTVELPNGLSATNLKVSINGNLDIRKSGLTYWVSATVIYYMVSKSSPVEMKHRAYEIEDPDVPLYTFFYGKLKEQFPGAEFTDDV